jgi:hypothetical protein
MHDLIESAVGELNFSKFPLPPPFSLPSSLPPSLLLSVSPFLVPHCPSYILNLDVAVKIGLEMTVQSIYL